MMNKKIERFLAASVKRYLETNTYESYKVDLSQLDTYMINNIGENWIEEVTNDDMEDYVGHLMDSGEYKNSTINRKIASAGSFFKYCLNKEWIEKDPMRGIKPLKVVVEQKDMLRIEEVRTVIASTYDRQAREKFFEFNSARNRFILALLSTTGLRISELINIKLDSLEKINGGYMVNIAPEDVKNDIAKRVPVSNKTLEYYNEYMQERSARGFDTDTLILSRTGKKLTRKSVREMIQKYCERSGIEGLNITPHSFRHTCTTTLRKNKVEDTLIYNILGWKREGMAGRYTNDMIGLDEAKIECCNIL
jgi:site-specific recombinase XerD